MKHTKMQHHPAPKLKGSLKNSIHGIFLYGKAKTRFSPFLHFQSLVVIENGSTSLCRSCTSIFRGVLKPPASNHHETGQLPNASIASTDHLLQINQSQQLAPSGRRW